jgi:hypothetical protein
MVLVAVCVLALGGATAYLVASRAHEKEIRDKAPGVAQTSLTTLLAGPHIVFRNTNLHDAYGMVSVVSLAHPNGPRALTTKECDRVYAAARKVLCLSSSPGVATTYAAHVLDTDMTSTQSLPLTGIPSRARLSADGRFAATTSFTAGDSYAGSNFSTRTVISQVGRGVVANLEDFTLKHDGRSIKPVDRNFWGVTFAANDDTFYATVQWSGHTWLVRGSLSERRVVTLHEDAECPSLAPDGRTIVYKQRGDLPVGHWRLVRYDVATGKVSALAETRSVDDQVAWLDNAHVMYGLPRTGSNAGVDDVWTVPADGSGKPSVLIPEAWSPALVSAVT